MKNYLLSILFIALNGSIYSQTLTWGKSFGGSGEDVLKSLHVDIDGNIYTTGFFNETADFDMGENEFNLTSEGDLQDVFVQKVDTDGNFLWAKRFGSAGNDTGMSITTDLLGNVYIGGTYEGSVDFDPSSEEFILNSIGDLDIFVVKLNANGDFLWAKSMGSEFYEDIVEIKMSDSGSLILMGYFSENFDADPGVAEQIFNSQGSFDIFLIELNQSGELIKAKSYGGNGFDLGMDMKITSNGFILITGIFKGTIDLDPSETEEYFLTSTGGNNSGYTLVLDGDMNFLNAHSTNGGRVNFRAVSVTQDGSIYVTGDMQDAVNFGSVNGADIILDSPFAPNAFVMKLDFNANLQWVLKVNAEEPVFGLSVVANADQVFISGFYENLTDFNPSETAEFNLEVESLNATDAFLAIYSSNGEFVNAVNFGGVDFIDTHRMEIDIHGDLILGAHYGYNIDIDPSPENVIEMTAVDWRDSYILKFGLENLGIGEEVLNTFSVYPNPTDDMVFIKGLNLYNTPYMIFDMLGREVKSGKVSNDQGISFPELSKGAYTLIIDKINKFKVIKN
ncbi:putative secreted protein (Por secretion system target) [Gelidibacter algens]|uniref:Putative secreted protein (Por secretion system target) n=1 Tax=Gelidibacter algens TaxID=49280 RepID=A0A327S2U3_9FLAO|nr:T9SS type A sorting domain-containing protein [Gelidibacter algens]RAJ19997.1 putative secreted protein (Por secretion system target) [Gelidibacter algens]